MSELKCERHGIPLGFHSRPGGHSVGVCAMCDEDRDSWKLAYEVCKAEADSLRKMAESHSANLLKYGLHKMDCEHMGKNHECSCGFSQAYHAAKAALGEK